MYVVINTRGDVNGFPVSSLQDAANIGAELTSMSEAHIFHELSCLSRATTPCEDEFLAEYVEEVLLLDDSLQPAIETMETLLSPATRAGLK